MIIHGTNCACRIVPETVVGLINDTSFIRWVRECQRDPGFWTLERVELEKQMRRAIDESSS